MWLVLHAFKTYFRIIPSWQSYDSLSRIYCCPEKVFKVKLFVRIQHQQYTDPLSSSTSSSLLGTACTASAFLKKHLTIKFLERKKNHLVLMPRLLRIIIQSESSNTPPTDQKGEIARKRNVNYFFVIPNPAETQIHSVFKLMSLQPSTATCLAPNSFLSSFASSFNCSLKHMLGVRIQKNY